MGKTKNVFISHFGGDDEHVTGLKELLDKKGYTLKNFSIDSSRSNFAENEDYIKSLLRPGIQAAGTVICLIGPKTHTREWVQWEIEQAVKNKKRIVGIYIEGARESELPDSVDDFADAIVGWNSDTIIRAIGSENLFLTPDGTPREKRKDMPREEC